VPEPYEDDLAAEAAPEQLPDVPPFLGGSTDISLMSSYASHIALLMYYNANNVSVNFFLLHAKLKEYYEHMQLSFFFFLSSIIVRVIF